MSRTRKWLFRLAAATLVPAGLLLLLEAGLWIAGTGRDTSFLIPEDSADGQAVLVDNPTFAWSFFPRAIARRSQPIRLSTKSKGEAPIRIFVLGGSAVMGDPQPAYGLPHVVEVMLDERYPDRDFEVVNAAMTAINSHVLVPIARDCVKAGADLLVVYAGNNEVVGPFGPGTTLGEFSSSATAVRSSLWVRGTHVGQLFEELLGADEDPGESWEGMEMFLDRQVPAWDSRLASVRSSFRANLTSICDLAKGAGVPVLLCTVPANVTACAPFASVLRPGLTANQQNAWRAHYTRGNEQMADGTVELAVSAYRKAAEIDDGHAELRWRLGRCLQSLGEREQAVVEMQAALEYDALRFRADSSINAIIAEVATSHDNAWLADLEAAAAAASSDGVPGADVLLEHVHLSFHGNVLLGQALVPEIADRLPELGEPTGKLLARTECARRLGHTPWAQVVEARELARRFERPPFVNQFGHEQRLAVHLRYLKRITERMDSKLERTCAEVMVLACEQRPDDWQLAMETGRLLQGAGDDAGAAIKFGRVCELLPHYDEAHHVLAVALAGSGDTAAAKREFQRTVELNPRHALAHLNFGQFEVSQERVEAGTALLEVAVRLDPDLPEAWVQLGNAQAAAKEHARAVESYQQAISLNPDDWRARFNCAVSMFEAGQKVEALGAYLEAARVASEQGNEALAKEIMNQMSRREAGGK